MAMAQSVIREILNDEQPVPVTVDKIVSEVADVYGVTPEDIRSDRRPSQISAARKVAIYVVREVTQKSFAAIGAEFGGRDHSTIVYAKTSVDKAMQKDGNLRQIIEDIIRNVKNQ